jgi:hypothetical protein
VQCAASGIQLVIITVQGPFVAAHLVAICPQGLLRAVQFRKILLELRGVAALEVLAHGGAILIDGLPLAAHGGDGAIEILSCLTRGLGVGTNGISRTAERAATRAA